MRPSIGRIVAYKLTETDAWVVNSRREDGARHAHTRTADGAQVHVGPDVAAGDVLPLIITRVEYVSESEVDEETAAYVNGAEQNEAKVEVVNGQVVLDGNDTLWVTHRFQCYREADGQPEPGFWAQLPPAPEPLSPTVLAQVLDETHHGKDGQA